MAATTAAAARSASPAPARPCGAMRKSMDLSPFRLSSSPSDSPQRGCASKNCGAASHPSPRSCCAEKENEQRDPASALKAAAKARSGSGAKSFMAPTISAASKAVVAAPSPRKKVLGERNELAVRSPVEHLQQVKEVPEVLVSAPRCLKLSFEEAAAGSRHSHGRDEQRMEDLGCKNHHHPAGVLAFSSPSSTSAPVDADPARPPYDPKTNYLSPRPRFLHYKPNPRIEQYWHGEGGVERLEDSFSSESGEGTTTEEELTEEEQEQSPSLQKDSSSESESVPSEAEAEVVVPAETSVLTPEPLLDSPRAHAKPRSSRRFLLAPLALVLFMAAACICVPILDSPVMSHTTVSKASAFLSVQELHPVELAAGLRHWSSNCFASVAFYLATLGSPQGQEFGPHFAANFSAADAGRAGGFYYNIAEARPGREEPRTHSGLEQEFKEDIGHEKMEKTRVEVSAGATEVIAEPEAEMAQVDAVAEEETVEQEVIHTSVEEEPNEHEDLVVKEEELNGEMAEEEMPSSNAEEIVSSRLNFETSSQSAAEPEQVDAVVEEETVEQEVILTSVKEDANEHDDLVVEEVELNGEMAEEEIPSSNGEEIVSSRQNFETSSQSAAEPEQVENSGSSESSLHPGAQTDESGGNHFNDKEEQEAYPGLKSEEEMSPGYWGKISTLAAVGTAFATVVVAAIMAFLYIKHKQARVVVDVNAPAEQAEQIEAQSGSGSSEGHLLAKGSQFQDPAVDDTERIGDSGASQYSSSLSSGRRGRSKAKEEESLSLEPRSRRESAVYSSSSYGSFTTYEKLSAKKRSKDDEAMTPVRRSSRIRSQVTSP